MKLVTDLEDVNNILSDEDDTEFLENESIYVEDTDELDMEDADGLYIEDDEFDAEDIPENYIEGIIESDAEDMNEFDAETSDLIETIVSEDGINIDVMNVESSKAEVDTEETDTDSVETNQTIQMETTCIDDQGALVVADANDTGDKFKLEYVDVKDIVVPEKRIREFNSSEALIRSIAKTGLLKPIEVIKLENGKYQLVNGYRRVIACLKNGIKKIPCIINTKVQANTIDILEAVYNHYTPYTNKEISYYISHLEKDRGILDANVIEFLLQLPSGDYTKLKDVLADNDEDIVNKLMDDKLTISAAYKKLESRRKKESKDTQDAKKVDKMYSESNEEFTKTLDDAGVMGDEDSKLSDDEIKELALTPKDIINVDNNEQSLDEMVEESKEMKGFEPHKQDYRHREFLAPELRKAVLARDNNTCQICQTISGQEYTEVLDVHHIIEVYLGGSDDIDNLITACTVCHKLIHLYARGDLHIRPESEMSEEERVKFKRIVKLGDTIRKGMKKKGMKKEDLKKVDKAETIGRTKPGTERQVAG